MLPLCTRTYCQAFTRSFHTSSILRANYRYRQMDGSPFVNKNKQHEIRLMEPNKEAMKRFWWKEDGTVWHWPRSDTAFFNHPKYLRLRDRPVQVTDPARLKMVKQLLGPYNLYRQTKYYRHPNDYEQNSYQLLSRDFLGLPKK